ncbi:MAG: phosphatidate cytidylyltransferase [Clostridia bacterium]|nr:phosphatidate cytidylyltransferase [Clostridia bacterium]
MVKRIVTAVVCLAVFIPVLLFSGTYPIVFVSVLSSLALVSIYEVCGCIGVRKAFYISLPSYLSAACVLVSGILFSGSYSKISTHTFTLIIFAVSFFYVFWIFSTSMLSNGMVRFSQACETAAVTAYILIGFLSVVFVRYSEMGQWLFMLIFLGAWMTDSGAYFIGVLFGKHKLIPAVSPNKTVEGAFGGVLGCVVGFSLYGLIISSFFDVQVNYIYLIILAVIVAIVDQLGDLIASYIKREQNIKDYGNIFPGHGGVMDRFDSTIAIAPVIYIVSVIIGFEVFA